MMIGDVQNVQASVHILVMNHAPQLLQVLRVILVHPVVRALVAEVVGLDVRVVVQVVVGLDVRVVVQVVVALVVQSLAVLEVAKRIAMQDVVVLPIIHVRVAHLVVAQDAMGHAVVVVEQDVKEDARTRASSLV